MTRLTPTSRAIASPASPAALADSRSGWLLVLLVAVALADVVRLGWFGDDFIFVDAARRYPLAELLGGEHGVRPWYRPLSRELFFAVIDRFGRWAEVVGHVLALGAVAVAADSLRRVLGARFGAAAGRVAVVLFVIHPLTRFLAGWLSGFQDLSALALVQLGLRFHQQRRTRAAAVCMALAPFGKETGFLALPLALLDARFGEGRWFTRREVTAYGAGVGIAIVAHAAVRLAWAPAARTPAAPVATLASLRELAAGLLPLPSPPGPATAWGATAAVAVALLVFAFVAGAPRSASGSARHGGAWLAGAGLATAALAVVPALVLRDPVRGHFLFSALPWVCAAASVAWCRWGAGSFRAAALALGAGLCVWQCHARPVDVDAPAGWEVGRLGWTEAQRIEARTRRLEHSLRASLAGRPDSLVVLYARVPAGGWFQTVDGPATRVALADPSVTAHFLSEAAVHAERWGRRPVALVSYDPVERHEFVRVDMSGPAMTRGAVLALLEGEWGLARGYALLAAREGGGLWADYAWAAVTFLADADSAAFRRLAARVRTMPPEAVGLGEPRANAAAYEALARPFDAEAHRRAAVACAAAGHEMLAAFELALAVGLDSTRVDDAVRLGLLLAPRTPAGARRAFAAAMGPGTPSDLRAAAQAGFDALATKEPPGGSAGAPR